MKERKEYMRQFTHKKNKQSYTDWDMELIDMALSTTYRSDVGEYILQADTEKAKDYLKNILNSNDVEWEDKNDRRRW